MSAQDLLGPPLTEVAPDDAEGLRLLFQEQRARIAFVQQNAAWGWFGGVPFGFGPPAAMLRGTMLSLAMVGAMALTLVVAGCTRGPVLGALQGLQLGLHGRLPKILDRVRPRRPQAQRRQPDRQLLQHLEVGQVDDAERQRLQPRQGGEMRHPGTPVALFRQSATKMWPAYSATLIPLTAWSAKATAYHSVNSLRLAGRAPTSFCARRQLGGRARGIHGLITPPLDAYRQTHTLHSRFAVSLLRQICAVRTSKIVAEHCHAAHVSTAA